jgi:hypothetical protein
MTLAPQKDKKDAGKPQSRFYAAVGPVKPLGLPSEFVSLVLYRQMIAHRRSRCFSLEFRIVVSDGWLRLKRALYSE